MAFFGFGKGKSGGSKKPAKKTKTKAKKKQRLISIKNLHLNPTIEDSLYKTLAEGVGNPDEPYISIATIDNQQFIYELALTDKLIHQNEFDKGEPNIISQIKTGLALTGKHGNDVPKGLVNGSFFFDLDPEEGTEAQIVFVPTVGTLRRLEDLGGDDAKYQLVIIPADIDADNYDEYYQEGLINSPLQDDDGSDNRLVTIDEFKSLAEEGAGSPDLQANEGVEEELDEDDYIAPPSEQTPGADDSDLDLDFGDDLASGNLGAGDDLTSSNDDDLTLDTGDDLTSGNDDLTLDTGDDDLTSGNDDLSLDTSDDDLTSGNDDLSLDTSDDDLTSGNDDLTLDTGDDLTSGNDDLTLDTSDDLTSSNDDDLALDADDDLSLDTPSKNDPLASNDDDFKLDPDDDLGLIGNDDPEDGLNGFLSDEDEEDGDVFTGYDGKPNQGPTAGDELSSDPDDLTVENSDEPEEVPDDTDDNVGDSDDELDELDDDDDESTDGMFDGLTNDDDDDWDEEDDEPDENDSEDDDDESEDTSLDNNEPEDTEETKETGSDDDEPEDTENTGSNDNESDSADSADSDKSKKKKSNGDGEGDGNNESKPTAKDLGYVDINKQNLDSFIRQNIIQLDNALDGLDARLFPIDAKHDNQSMIGYKTMYNGLLESQAKREKELIRTKFKHQLTQLLDPYVNHTAFSDNFPKIDTAFQEKLFDPVDIDAEKTAGQTQIEDRYKELHQKLIDDAIAKAEDDYTNNYEPVKAQELEEASKAIDASRRQKYDQAVDRVLNKAFYLNEADLSKEAQKIASRFIANDVAEANFELTNKAISYSEEMMRYMQFDKMIDARMGSTQKVDDSVMRQTIEDLQNRLNRQVEENKSSEKKIAALQSEINKAKTAEPVKTPKPAEPVKTPEPVIDGGDNKVPPVVHDELKTGNEMLAEIKRAMVEAGRQKPAKEIIKTAEFKDNPEK